jgi:hypothetical protein
MPFPISLRVLPFSRLYKTLDPAYNSPAVSTYASELRERFQVEIPSAAILGAESDIESDRPIVDNRSGGPFRQYQKQAIEALARNESFLQNIKSNGVPWGVVTGMLKEALPSTLADRDSIAYNLVPTALDKILGPKDKGWTTERRGAKSTLFIVKVQP